MKATVFLVLSLAFVFGRVMAAPLDEDQTMAEDENQVNSLDSNEYSQQLYEKPTHLDDPGAIKRFLRSLMSSVSDPPLLKAKLIVVARSPLHEIIADNNGMSENDAKLMQIFAMNQLHQIEAMEFKLMRENQKPNSMGFPGNFQDDDYEY